MKDQQMWGRGQQRLKIQRADLVQNVGVHHPDVAEKIIIDIKKNKGLRPS